MQVGNTDSGRQLKAVPACSGHTDTHEKIKKGGLCWETKDGYILENIRGNKQVWLIIFPLSSQFLLSVTKSNDCHRLLRALRGLIPAVSVICPGGRAASQSVILFACECEVMAAGRTKVSEEPSEDRSLKWGQTAHWQRRWTPDCTRNTPRPFALTHGQNTFIVQSLLVLFSALKMDLTWK